MKKYLLILLLFFTFFSSKLLSNEFIQLQIREENNSLSILSWNIKMFMPPYGWLHNCVERSENIIKVLKNSKVYDVILFQEAFSANIRTKIYSALKDIYPNQIEPHDNTQFYKINSGLWVISSISIELIDKINFTEMRHVDRLSSKGAHLYSVIKNKHEFNIINTHLQADYETKYCDIRIGQYIEIKKKLILPYENLKIPIILCGDLNIAKLSNLKLMLETLNIINGPLAGKLHYSSLGSNHELLDYILVKMNQFKFKTIERRIQNMSVHLIIDPIQFSDHHPIEGIFKW